jgi:hypothetical protein
MRCLWIVEHRVGGELLLAGPQPESVFGDLAFLGITEDQMAKVVYDRCPDKSIKLSGMDISNWLRHLHPNWVARVKTW